MKLLFIDSNILLNFYGFCDEDLDRLSSLIDLIKAGEIKLFITTQVCNEVKRNRETKLKEAYGKFADAKCDIPMPPFTKHYNDHSQIKRAQNVLNKLKARLGKALAEDIQNNQLKADQVVADLVRNSVLIDSDKYLEKAEKRHKLGNPPGKKDRSFGDEINWEALLDEVTEEGNFIIISQDGDYANAIDSSRLKDYLTEEWEKKNPSEIFLYRSLSIFFKDHDIKIELRIEEEKNELIRELINSGSFLSTHSIIAQLGKYASFSDDQVRGMATALEQNNQVSWLVGDDDVKSFYEDYLLPKADLFDEDTWLTLRSLILVKEEGGDLSLEIKSLEEESNKEDIPF